MNAGQAVSASRLHAQWLPDKLRLEKDGFDDATLQNLRAKGHVLDLRSPWGNANLIQVRPDHTLESAADPRGEGSAAGF